ncbi:MAG TPA: glycosyl hydrolase 108 family protein [Syntrophorhabdaceae bacterium]|nr:glycosyl hydrolase 108 family protein [Syntrophorhabdaceae bacterium]
MGLYTELLDIIILSKMAEKRKNDLSRLSQTNETDFQNLLKENLTKINTLPQNNIKRNVYNPVVINQIFELSGDKDKCFEVAYDFVLKQEGDRFVQRDGIKNESSKYGILQSTAKEFGYKGDIKHMTKEQAKIIYKKIWDKSGAGNLSYPLSIVYFDTYVNSPTMAKKLLEKSGGDIVKFLDMREQRYIRLSKIRPDIFGVYLKGWIKRVDNLRAMIIDYGKSHGTKKT